METLFKDIRYGVRGLARRPGFTAVAVIALALGIGANTAIFSVVNAVLLRPLPLSEPDRLVSIWERGVREGIARSEMAPANFIDLRAQNRVFENVGAFIDESFNLTGDGQPERLEGQRVSANVLALLGVHPAAGRLFLSGEDEPGQHRVAVLSYALWQRRFGGDAGIVGKQITLDSQGFTVVGVMPAGFFFPDRASELWTPLAMEPDEASGRGDHYLRVVARLKPGLDRKQAETEAETIAAGLAADYPRTNAGVGFFLSSLEKDYIGNLQTPLLVLLAATGLVLLIACANVASLLLARARSRHHELAIRSALGAGGWRIARQLLTESAVLACFGGVAGLLLAVWGVAFLSRFVPQSLSQIQDVTLDARVLLFTLLLTIVTGVIFGLAPALHASKTEILGDGARVSGGPGRRRTRAALVISEVALSLVLLIGAGLLMKSFQRLNRVDLGFRTDNLLTMRMVLPPAKYRDLSQRRAFYDEVLTRVKALPGIESAGMISFLPLSFSGMNFSFTVEGRPAPPDMNLPLAVYRAVSPDYFRTMGIPALRGRSFDAHDTVDAPAVVVINRSLAEKFWPGEEAIGKRLKVGPASSPNPWTTIVGVVGDVHQGGLYEEPGLEMYVPYMQERRVFVAPRDMVVLTRTDANALAEAVRNTVWGVDKDQPVSNIRTMDQVLAATISAERFQTLLLGIFASLALVLSSVGLYGVMSYDVTQRSHEIGVRMALGAQRKDVFRLVINQGMVLTFTGVALGLGAALATTRLMSGMLFGVTATDLPTFVGVAVFLCVVAFLACYIPARRATKVDPLVALRYE